MHPALRFLLAAFATTVFAILFATLTFVVQMVVTDTAEGGGNGLSPDVVLSIAAGMAMIGGPVALVFACLFGGGLIWAGRHSPVAMSWPVWLGCGALGGAGTAMLFGFGFGAGVNAYIRVTGLATTIGGMGAASVFRFVWMSGRAGTKGFGSALTTMFD